MEEALFLKVFSCDDSNIKCPLETLIALSIYRYCEISEVSVIFIKCEETTRVCVDVNVSGLSFSVSNHSQTPWQVLSCKLPVFTAEHVVITGLCAVARRLCKYKKALYFNEHPDGILGFRSSCLQAPNEVSVWTKFCEIEILEATENLMSYISIQDHIFEIPTPLVKFEVHLSQPFRVHNISKVVRDFQQQKKDMSRECEDEEQLSKAMADLDTELTRRTPKQRRWKPSTTVETCQDPINILKHTFAEGPYLTLADVILYPYYTLLFTVLHASVCEHLPLTTEWFGNLKSMKSFMDLGKFLDSALSNLVDPLKKPSHGNMQISHMPKVGDVSLYKCDPKRSNPKKRYFTKEQDVESALQLITNNMEISLQNNILYKLNSKIEWSTIPVEANPFGGYLPDKRKERKTQQLENLVLAVMSIAKDGDRIVDFCSGTGHLGILLAYLLPKCTIILLENKEESVNRANSRVKDLKLTNVYFFQCNLDFFIGVFDIGVALHACGIATDLVLENCIRAKASFVVCPCCYGSLHVTERLQYPRSKVFASIPLDKYMCIGHAADQTHTNHPLEIRGTRCMCIIDSDRAQHAISNGYSVQLTRLSPLSCTPKNILITGVLEKQDMIFM